MGRKGIEIVTSDLEREQLLSMSRSRSLPHSCVFQPNRTLIPR